MPSIRADSIIEITTRISHLASFWNKAHIINRDGISSIEDSRDTGVLSAILLEPFRFAASLTPLHLSGFSGAFLKSVDSVSDTVSVNGYSKEHEFKADKDALSYLQRAAYNPSALIDYENKVLNHYKTVESGQQQTHPGLVERIKILETITPTVELDDSKVKERKKRFKDAVKG